MDFETWIYVFALEWEVIASVAVQSPAHQLRTWFATDQRGYVSPEHAARVEVLRAAAGLT